MTNKINLEIFTKDKKVFNGLVDSITISINNEDEITILPNHIPIITFVDDTNIIFRINKIKKVFKLGKGIFRFCENFSIVIVDEIK